MEDLGRQTDFKVEGTRFTGALCCLVLQKTSSYIDNFKIQTTVADLEYNIKNLRKIIDED